MSGLSEWVDADRAHVHRLTERHLAVLTGIARGGSNAEIAAALFMGTSTAHRLRVELFDRLNVGNAAHAVAVAYDYGILPVRSGVHSRPGETWRQCTCDATAGQECPECNGEAAEESYLRRCSPSERRDHEQAMAGWRALSVHPTTTETSGDAA